MTKSADGRQAGVKITSKGILLVEGMVLLARMALDDGCDPRIKEALFHLIGGEDQVKATAQTTLTTDVKP